ncbi:hypothetical protein DDB_G0290337 [Dictyostelium discoideum AX4]|uniref:PH domain-containing protein n=1 Tax=Dictyostelium discoideum TaxID=44689 RepID=Q54G74_DICDI|nr:hypothetical protein DDB_G0290337 [Dictyostelium discoideum AX4]EAL62295.1 hypothetical protein DDB_G0290337 [Dictyostelium discoideum AX4]|eukprot:XP_635809.1 hypothetical protein DDB_G0290337 [Dictyostelium discoideum AX4]
MMISDTENQPLSPNKNSSGNSGRNDLIIKLVFPPSSSIRSKFMFVQENQKVSDIVDYATQLAGLNPGYSLQLSASPTTGRPQWLDDDQLLISYSIPTSSEIKIKRKPGIKRRNTLSTIKPIKEGKVQKLTSITKIWTTRYLRLYSMRLAHSSNENDSSADHIQFADITNVDKEVNRKYTFVIYCQNNSNTTNTTTTSSSSTTTATVGSGNAGLSQSQTVSSFQNLSASTSGTNLFAESKKEKEYVFRCINQREAEDWITSIRSMLRSSRPDLLLPPLTPFLSVNNNTKNNNNNNNSNLILPPSPSPSNQLSLNNNNNSNSNNNNNIWTSPTLPSSMPPPTTPIISLNQSVTPTNEKNSSSATTIDREITPSQTPTKQRSLSFSFSKIGGNKRKELPPPFIQNQSSSSTSSSPSSTSSTSSSSTPPPPPTQSLSERNNQLEEEIKRLNEVLNRDTKSKVELEKKYQKIKAKMAILKKQRSRSLSTPATPEVPRKDKSSFIPTFLIGGSRVKDKDKDLQQQQQQQQQQSQNATATTTSNTQVSHKRHSSSSQSFNLNNLNNGSSYSNKGIMMDDDNTDNDITSSEMFTGSVFDDADISDFEKDKEIKDLKDQLVRIKEKIQLDLNEKTKVETSFKLLEKELFTQKKLDEKREREILVNEQRQDDQLDSMAELASRLKKTLFDLKEKLENEQQQQEDEEEEDEENEYIDVEDGHDDDTNNNISNINHDDSYQNENQYNINGKHNNSSNNNNNNKEHTINNENEEDDEELDVDYGDIGDDIEDYDDDKNESYIESGNITTASIKEDIDYQDLESTI